MTLWTFSKHVSVKQTQSNKYILEFKGFVHVPLVAHLN